MFEVSRKAEEFPGCKWLNTEKSLSIENLKGNIIVLDFWTYCCINCIHVLPQLKKLEEKYKDFPVVFIGVHSAKFSNENNEKNIQSAIERYEIDHPVVIDNEHRIWESYGINAWPSIVVIDAKGNITYKQSGERIESIDDVISSILEKQKDHLSKKVSIKKPEIKRKTALSFPGKVFYHDSELLISDSNNNRILLTKLDGTNAKIIEQIGSGRQGLRDGSFEEAEFNKPQGIFRQGRKIFIADTENHAIRLIDLEGRTVKTLAGNGKQTSGPPKEGNPFTELNSPWDVLLLDDFLYIAMAGSHQLWSLDLKRNRLEKYAGTGAEDIIDGRRIGALLAQPSGLTTDGKDIYFLDSETSSLRRVRGNVVETLIGHGLFSFGDKNGEFDLSLMQHPLGLDYKDGKIYIADTYNHSIRVADLQTSQLATMISHEDQKVCKIDSKSCEELPLYEPNDIIALEDRLIIADTNNHLIRILDLKSRKLSDIKLI